MCRTLSIALCFMWLLYVVFVLSVNRCFMMEFINIYDIFVDICRKIILVFFPQYIVGAASQYSRSLKIPNLLPLVCLFSFSSTPPPPICFGQNLPSPSSITILVKFREKKLIMSTSMFAFKKPQWNLYKVDTISV